MNLTVGRLMRAEEQGYDISDVESGILGRIFFSPISLSKACWALYDDRLKKAGVEDEEQFYDLLDGDSMQQMEEGMKEAVRAFFTWGADYITQIELVMEQIMDELRTMSERSEEKTRKIREESEKLAEDLRKQKEASSQLSGNAQESAA